MTDQPIETFEVPDDISELGESQEKQPYRTLLELWRAILSNSREVGTDPISLQWATKMVNTYPEIRFADVDAIHVGVFQMSAELADILDGLIDSDDECLKKADAAEDAEENAALYRQLLLDWQIYFLERELAWRPSAPDAAVQLAIISEVQQMFLGQTGLVAHLDQIGFQYTEDDQRVVVQALDTARNEILGKGGEGE